MFKYLLFYVLREGAILLARTLRSTPPYVTPAGAICLELHGRHYRLYR